MKLSAAVVENYKSFHSSGVIEFSSGFNVIVGQNNVGKTALMEALSLKFGNKLHRSLKTRPTSSHRLDGNSKVSMTFELDKQEFLILLRDHAPIFYVPTCSDNESAVTQMQRFMEKIENKVRITSIFHDGKPFQAFMEGYVNTNPGSNFRAMQLKIDPTSLDIIPNTDGLPDATYNQNFALVLTNVLSQRLYMFSAERMNVNEYEMGPVRELQPNAANLPQVLNYLQTTNPTRFNRLNQLLQIILPDILQITVVPVSSSRAKINVWSVDPNSERADLAMELSESGTGIGQVLAILYVAINSDEPRTIIIDEPQSFLHPGAVRKLFDILKQQRVEHQYIISTHSPTAVTAAEARSLFLVRKEGAESVVLKIAPEKTQELRIILSEVGARLSDVFGSDNILWAEGRTEELCFPLIYSKVVNRPLLGTTILGVVQTGDFEGKHSQTILEIYGRLSAGGGLLPPALGFIFDQEGRSEQEQQDLIRQSRGCVHFLGRRMYENYLLNPRAIACVTSKIEGFRGNEITEEEVSAWIERNSLNKKYFDSLPAENARTNELWLQRVHGAKLLVDLFNELSESRIIYDKIEHGVALTNWLLENSPSELSEVAELIKRILDEGITNRA